jgi:hypothetical protein
MADDAEAFRTLMAQSSDLLTRARAASHGDFIRECRRFARGVWSRNTAGLLLQAVERIEALERRAKIDAMVDAELGRG